MIMSERVQFYLGAAIWVVGGLIAIIVAVVVYHDGLSA
jgi:hypothetical protein